MRISASVLARLGLIPVLLVSIPLLAVGGWGLHGAWELYTDGAPTEEIAIWGAWGGGLVLVSLGVIYAAWRRRRRSQRRAEVAEKYKDAPWKAHAKWCSNTIPANRKLRAGAAITASVMGLVFWGVGIVALYVTLTQSPPQYLGLVFLAFPVAGTWWFHSRVVRPYRHRREFGNSSLTLDTMPAPRGGTLVGRIQTSFRGDQVPPDGFRVQLSCYRRIRVRKRQKNKKGRRKKRTKIRYQLLWRDEKIVRGGPSERGDGLEIPMAFDVPEQPPPTDLMVDSNSLSDTARKLISGRSSRTVWRIEVIGERPGMNYVESFDIPVLDVESSLDSTAQERLKETVEQEIQVDAPQTEGIEIERLPSGGVRFSFDSSRHSTQAYIAAAVAVVMIGAGVALFLYAPEDFPIYVPPLVVLFGVLAGWGAYSSTTRTSTVEVRDGVLSVDRTGGAVDPSGEASTIPFDEIEQVRVDLDRNTSKKKGKRRPESIRATYAIRVFRDPESTETGQKGQHFGEMVGGLADSLGASSAAEQMETHMTELFTRTTLAEHLTNKPEANWIAETLIAAIETQRESEEKIDLKYEPQPDEASFPLGER